MTTTDSQDVIDQLVGLDADDKLYQLRHQREKVAAATQGSYDVLFNTALEGVSVQERLLTALYASQLSGAKELVAHYQARLEELAADDHLISTILNDDVAALDKGRLTAILGFTKTLIENPVAGDKALLHTLLEAGISTPAVVTIAQLIAFVSYQIRVVAGLKAMKAAEQVSQ